MGSVGKTPRYASGAERLRAELQDPNLLIVSLGVYDGIASLDCTISNKTLIALGKQEFQDE